MKTRKRLGVLLGLGGLVLAAAAVIGGLLIARNYVFLTGDPTVFNRKHWTFPVCRTRSWRSSPGSHS